MSMHQYPLPKLLTLPCPYYRDLKRLMIGGYDELSPSVCADQAAEIVRRCNDYPDIAARLERAMGLLQRINDSNDSLTGHFDDEIAALLAEHEKEKGNGS